ncbi:DNA alkylation repair protein [Microlunatus speluncae]|uniref:DNA alkylation repair protein n=1 Tax=Microlunatus speluncae TaxID=2594267 RepID=UPI0012662521|nr:DNA alkylation repair protein [Microlunatus speluncae]
MGHPHPVVAAIEAEADPGRAAEFVRFFQVRPGGYGEGDTFVGVRLSRLRELVRPYRREVFDSTAWLPLLRSPIHEHRLSCLVIMADRARAGDLAERAMITDHYLADTRWVNNWDLVDASAGQILGRRLLDPDGDRGVLDRLAGSASLWERRIAMVATHGLILAGQTADTYRISERLLGDEHDLIHKAVGWMLREAGKRVDEAELRAFLDRQAPRMPRTALRYAIERFDPDTRRHYREVR